MDMLLHDHPPKCPSVLSFICIITTERQWQFFSGILHIYQPHNLSSSNMKKSCRLMVNQDIDDLSKEDTPNIFKSKCMGNISTECGHKWILLMPSPSAIYHNLILQDWARYSLKVTMSIERQAKPSNFGKQISICISDYESLILLLLVYHEQWKRPKSQLRLRNSLSFIIWRH